MKLVIDIAENMKKQIDDGKGETELGIPLWLAYSISKGTPLPKGHGRLIDVDVATKDINAFQDAFAMYTDNMGKYNIVCTAPTVIEADKDGE